MSEQLIRIVVGALMGAVMGWCGNSLTIVGRVDAFEKSLLRIEARLDALTVTAQRK